MSVVLLAGVACEKSAEPSLPPKLKNITVPCQGSSIAPVKERCGRFYPDATNPHAFISYAVLSLRGEPDVPVASLQEPLVYLSGGPGEGGNTASQKLDLWRYRILDWNIQRPVILWDSRGNAGGWGHFHCEAYRQLMLAQLNSPELVRVKLVQVKLAQTKELQEQGEELVAQGGLFDQSLTTEKCLQHWQQQLHGTGFEQFSAKQNALDIAALLTSLGYERWHLMAVSYGSRVAEWLALSQPQQVASVLLDSPYSWRLTSKVEKAKRWLSVISQYEQQGLATVASQLKQTPLVVRFQLDGLSHRAAIDDIQFLHLFFASRYQPESLVNWQMASHAYLNGRPESLSELLGPLLAMSLSREASPWLYWVAECMDNGMLDLVAYQEKIGALGLSRYWQADTGLLLCRNISDKLVPLRPHFEQPAKTPAIIMIGRYDPVVLAGDERDFPFMRSLLLSAPTEGHGLLASEACGTSWLEAFWRAPENFMVDAVSHSHVEAFVRGDEYDTRSSCEPFILEKQ